jgi:Hypothetical protein (DUF2513)
MDMPLDMELVRKIMLAMTGGQFPKAFESDKYTREQILYHCYQLKNGGYIEAIDRTDLSCPYPQAIPLNLTFTGHEFIANARNDTLWKRAISFVQEKGGAISVTTLGQVLASLAKKHFGIE